MVDILATTNDSAPSLNLSLALPRGSDYKLTTNAKIIGRRYKSGALYYGKIEENKRSGDGTFQWPSGIVYEGGYTQNLRHGSGKHTWQDGSRYTGTFHQDAREGYGELKWANGEAFDGEFLNDKKYGKGKYTWSDGSFYEGYFKNDKKWGYGKFCYEDGTIFEGLYMNDIRHGPGVLSYPDGAQDVGIWRDECLVSLCTVSDSKFDLEHVKQHSINSALRRKLQMTSEPKTCSPILNILSEDLQIGKDELASEIPHTFLVEDIVCGKRQSFGSSGKLEVLSQELLEATTIGDFLKVKQVLASKHVSPDVSDFSGQFPLLSASVNCHPNIINILLDYGADVNKLNDEGITALSACHVLLYTEDIFINNIAENMKSENIFNAVEWDKQKGVAMLRNERQMILDLYEQNRIKSAGTTSGKKKRPRSRLIGISSSNVMKEQSSSPNGEDLLSEDENDTGLEETKIDISDWKLDYFHRTIDRIEKLNSINENFQKLPMSSHFDFENSQSDDTSRNIATAGNLANPVGNDDVDPILGSTEIEPVSTSRRSLCDYSHLQSGKRTALTRKLEVLRRKLINSERKPHLESVIDLLLSRGANPNTATVPLPALFYAVKTGNVKAVDSLLRKGADPLIHLGSENNGLSPLHIAAALPRREGIEITKLLLQAGANPNARDVFFGSTEEGRTPLHVACCREDNYKESRYVTELLLSFNADPNLICHGHSPLTLAISSGNDMAVDTLLKYKADPSLPLPPGVGSALCVATAFTGERRRKANDRLKLIDKLVKAGADLLAPVLYMEKVGPGTVVDYAYHVFSQDRRIAHTPYHALSAAERECHNCRKVMLEHLGELLRTAALRRENEMIESELEKVQGAGIQYFQVSDDDGTKHGVKFDLSKPGLENKTQHDHSPNYNRSFSQSSGHDSSNRLTGCGLRYAPTAASGPVNRRRLESKKKFRYCYECGRSVGLRLTPCSRCKEVFFCSKPCKLKAWMARHKEECSRIADKCSKRVLYEDKKKGLSIWKASMENEILR